MSQRPVKAGLLDKHKWWEGYNVGRYWNKEEFRYAVTNYRKRLTPNLWLWFKQGVREGLAERKEKP